jgi:hypothetical protein
MMHEKLAGTRRPGRLALAHGHAASATHHSSNRAQLGSAVAGPASGRNQGPDERVGLPLASSSMSASERDRWCPAYLW